MDRSWTFLWYDFSAGKYRKDIKVEGCYHDAKYVLCISKLKVFKDNDKISTVKILS